jgi:hypothetical protein
MFDWLGKNTALKKEMLSIILKKFVDDRKHIDFTRLKLDYENYEPVIEQLLDERLCYQNNDQLFIDLEGFLLCNSIESKKIREDIDRLIPILRQKYRESPNSRVVVSNLAVEAGITVQDASMAVFFLNQLLDVVGSGSGGVFRIDFDIKEGIRKFKTFDEGVEVLKKWRKSHKISKFAYWIPWIKEHFFQIVMALLALATLFNTTYSTYFKK